MVARLKNIEEKKLHTRRLMVYVDRYARACGQAPNKPEVDQARQECVEAIKEWAKRREPKSPTEWNWRHKDNGTLIVSNDVHVDRMKWEAFVKMYKDYQLDSGATTFLDFRKKVAEFIDSVNNEGP